MLNNNISNKQAPYIVFDIDTLLFVEKEETGIFERLKDAFKTEQRLTVEKPFNKPFVKRLEYIWNHYNLCIGLVSFDITTERYELEQRLMEANIPYTRLFLYDEWEDLREADFLYKVSSNEELLSYLSSTSAIHYDNLGDIIK